MLIVKDLSVERLDKKIFENISLSLAPGNITILKGKNGSGKVFMRSAPAGTGIIAGGAVRAVCEVLGIKDIVAKSLGTANPHNVIRACMKALAKQNSPKNI